MIKGIFLSIFLPIFGPLALAQNPQDISPKIVQKALDLKLDQHVEWLNLIHYKKTLLGGLTSEADSPNFFLSPKGKTEPREELIASLKGIIRNTEEAPDVHPQCRFPARTLFFKRHLGNEYQDFFQKNCPLYQAYKEKLAAKSVSLVFSAYYLNNPSSAFGHTLMRFRKEKNAPKGKSYELLDYAINYGADVTTQNPILYAIYGFTGGFDGVFTSMPYFYKVREYNDFESRDLWDYELNLTDDEIEKLVAHAFEMRQTHFDYYYLTENCSYHMLGLLDAANPNWRLTERNPYFVIPVDTIQTVVNTPGLLKKVSFRPSKLRIIKGRMEQLNEQEFLEFKKLISSHDPKKLSEATEAKSKAKILDTVIDFIDYKYAEDVLMTGKDAAKWKRNFLIARSKIDHKTPPLNIPMPQSEQPHLGHGSRKASLGGGLDSHKSAFTLLEYRFALHDLIESPIGHNRNATMEMGNLKLRFYPNQKERGGRKFFDIDDFSLFRVESLSPLERYFSTMSWKVNLGYRRVFDNQCTGCTSPFFELGGGLSYQQRNFLIYSMIKSELEISSDFLAKGYRFGFGPDLNLLYRFTDKLSLALGGDYLKKYSKSNQWIYSYHGKLHWNYSPNKSLQVDYKKYESKWDSSLKLAFYY